MTEQVSIIIPSYNSAQWVCNAVNSCLCQSHRNCEIIVVDDGSTDNTRELLLQCYGETIRYIHQENRGLAGARNTGLRHAQGDFIQFLDADDEITPLKIKTQLRTFYEHPESSVVFSDYEFFDNSAPEVITPSPESYKEKYKSGNLWKYFLTGNFIVCHAALARKEDVVAAGCFDESLRACEDYDLWMRMAGQGKIFYYSEGVMARYRVTPGSMSSARAKQIQWTIDVLKKNIARFGIKNPEERYAADNYLATLHKMLGQMFHAQGRSGKAMVQLCRAILLKPGNWRALTRGVLHERSS